MRWFGYTAEMAKKKEIKIKIKIEWFGGLTTPQCPGDYRDGSATSKWQKQNKIEWWSKCPLVWLICPSSLN
jgi:hypothetical protein